MLAHGAHLSGKSGVGKAKRNYRGAQSEIRRFFVRFGKCALVFAHESSVNCSRYDWKWNNAGFKRLALRDWWVLQHQIWFEFVNDFSFLMLSFFLLFFKRGILRTVLTVVSFDSSIWKMLALRHCHRCLLFETEIKWESLILSKFSLLELYAFYIWSTCKASYD